MLDIKNIIIILKNYSAFFPAFFRAITFLFTIFSSSAFSQELEFDFTIPSQNLDDALVSFSVQTNIQFLYTNGNALSTQASDLFGSKTISEALETLLMGTGFSYEFSNQDTVRIYELNALVTQSDLADPERESSKETDDIDYDSTKESFSSSNNDSSRRNTLPKEVIVTARMREENIQEVPISIVAFEAARIESSSIENVEDMNVLLPNVNIRGNATNGGSSGLFAIRGVPGVSRYIDGVPQQAPQGALFNLLDIERVEILRGPQGTLFGKNALSGAIQYVTKKPVRDFQSQIKFTSGSFKRKDLVVSVDIPLSDTLFSKTSLASFERGGYVNTSVPGYKHGNLRNIIFREQLLWDPSANFEANLALESNRINQNQQANVLYDVIESQVDVIAYNANNLLFTDASHAFGLREQYQNTSGYTGPGFTLDSLASTLNLHWSLSDSIGFRSITGAKKFDYGNYQDLDATSYAFFQQFNYSENSEYSQEFRLTANTRLLKLSAGFYWASYETDLRLLAWKYADIPSRESYRNEITNTVRRDRALFIEGSYQFSDRLDLTLGLRNSKESFSNANYLSAEQRLPIEVLSSTVDYGVLIQANQTDFSSTIPRVSLAYDWSQNIMSYLTYSEGFNGGGFNGQAINGQFIPYDSELLSQYELGFRSDIFNNRLRINASYFTGDWDNIQLTEVVSPGIFTTQNAGGAEIEGFEVDLLWIASDQLTLNATAGLLDTSYTSIGQTTTVSTGSAFALAPKRSYSLGMSYDWPTLRNGGDLSFRADYGWLDEHFTIADIRLQKLQNAYGLLNARLSYLSSDKNWDVSIFGTNLTDEWYQLAGFSAFLGGVDQGVVARPREIGITVGLSFN